MYDYKNALTGLEFALETERQLPITNHSTLAEILFDRDLTLSYLEKHDEARSL